MDDTNGEEEDESAVDPMKRMCPFYSPLKRQTSFLDVAIVVKKVAPLISSKKVLQNTPFLIIPIDQRLRRLTISTNGIKFRRN